MGDSLLKQLLLLAEPIGLLWLALAALAIALFVKKQRLFAAVVAVLWIAVSVVGATDFPGWLMRGLERPFAGVEIEKLPQADAVVLLGGGLEPAKFEASGLHFTKAGDRVIMALELMRLGKAPVLVLGGGGAEFDEQVFSEADRARDWLATWKLPAAPAQVLSLGLNGTTFDEATKVRTLAKDRGWKRILLVTSASHMRRAAAVMRTQTKLEVVPAPCNFLTVLSTLPSTRGIAIPTYGGFEKISLWMHEIIGWEVYRRRGWIDSDV